MSAAVTKIEWSIDDPNMFVVAFDNGMICVMDR